MSSEGDTYSGEGRLPARAALAGRPGEGAAALRRLRRQPSALHRRQARTLFSFSRSAPPLGRAPRLAGCVPRPALPAQGCGPRRREQRILSSSPARASTVGAAGERKRKRLSTWTCLWRVAKQSSQIIAPGGKKNDQKKKKKNPCYCFRRHITFLHFPGSSGLAF